MNSRINLSNSVDTLLNEIGIGLIIGASIGFFFGKKYAIKKMIMKNIKNSVGIQNKGNENSKMEIQRINNINNEQKNYSENITKELDTWAGRSTFLYSGNMKNGLTIFYGNNYKNSRNLNSLQTQNLIEVFRGKRVEIGTSRDNPPSGSLGEWMRKNFSRTAIASYIGPILIHEGYATKAGTQIVFYK